MKIEFWQNPGFRAAFGALTTVRTYNNLTCYAWEVPDDQAEAAQVWVKSRMLVSPEPQPPPAPPLPTRREILRAKAAAGTLTQAEILEALKEVL